VDLGLRGRIALVCASSKGLGRATALRLAAEQASVILCGRDEEALTKVAEEIVAHGGACLPVTADLTSASDRERLTRQGVERFGAIDIAVLNTAGPPTGRFEEHSLETWNEAYRTVLEPVVHIAQLVLPGMSERKFGRILANASFTARAPADRLVLSNSLRGAVVGLIKSIANEYGAHGVTANCILPGYFLTDRMRSVVSAQSGADAAAGRPLGETIVKDIPVGRWGDPDEFAAVSAFLVSQLAGYVTGAAFTLDGGLVRSVY
jgi:3-oxoacyl-[acyl-carrier protein] reductase